MYACHRQIRQLIAYTVVHYRPAEEGRGGTHLALDGGVSDSVGGVIHMRKGECERNCSNEHFQANYKILHVSNSNEGDADEPLLALFPYTAGRKSTVQ